MVLMTCL